MPSVTGVLETALYAQDLERAVVFYQDLFDFSVLLRDDRLCALSVVDRQVLLLFQQGASVQPNPVENGVIPPHDGSGPVHMAFSIPLNSVDEWKESLRSRGIALEAELPFEHGARSLYFRDPDGHLIELVTPGVWAIY